MLDPTHTDDGSELTLSVLLVAPEAGGELATWSAEGALVTHPLAVGDALLFHSAKRHNVTQVGGGCRTSLVVEPGARQAALQLHALGRKRAEDGADVDLPLEPEMQRRLQLPGTDQH